MWLTGLSGSISSSNNTLDTISSSSFNTAYSLNIASSKLFQDRWAAGLNLTATRASTSGALQRESESIFLGPTISYFFSKSKDGSLFLEFSPGYVRFFEKASATSNSVNISQSVDGNGFGINAKFGYAYVLNEKIVFNFGMNVTNFWIDADRVSEPAGTSENESINLGSIAFSFGFSVLLDQFFF